MNAELAGVGGQVGVRRALAEGKCLGHLASPAQAAVPGLAGESEPSEALRGPLSPFVHPLMSLSSFSKPSDV